MRTSNQGIDLIKSFEGCRLKSYQDSVGVWTIGYGHTSGVKPGMEISQIEAEQYLRQDLIIFEGYVNGLGRTLQQWEFDALVSFSYNCGKGNLKKLTDGRSIAEIGANICKYNKAGGKVLPGLTRRRQAEKAMLLGKNNYKKDIQAFLRDHGAPDLAVDGIIGPKTKAAIKNFLKVIEYE